MSLLSSSQISGMQDTAQLSLPDTGTVYRKTLSSDSAGGFTISQASSGTVACRLDPISNRDAVLQVYADRIGSRPVFILNLAYDADVLVGDVVTISTVDYEVIGVLDRSWEITMQALVVKHD